MDKNEPLKLSENLSLFVKCILLGISWVFGLSGIFLFIWKGNIGAVGCCLTLEVVCLLLLQLNYAVIQGKLHEKYTVSRLKFINILSIVLAIGELGLTIAYMIMAIDGEQDFHLEHNGYYVVCIPSSLACLWGFRLACESRHYMEEYNTGAPKKTVEFVNVVV